MASTTARASGVNRISRCSRQEHHRHEHDADAQRGDERRHGDLARAVQNRAHTALPMREVAMNVFDLHRGVVHQNADRERHTAQRHDIDGLAQRYRIASEVRMDRGIEMQTISVLRQLPRNSRIIRPVSTAAMIASLTTPEIAALHEDGLVEQRADFQSRRQRRRDAGKTRL